MRGVPQCALPGPLAVHASGTRTRTRTKHGAHAHRRHSIAGAGARGSSAWRPAKRSPPREDATHMVVAIAHWTPLMVRAGWRSRRLLSARLVAGRLACDGPRQAAPRPPRPPRPRLPPQRVAWSRTWSSTCECTRFTMSAATADGEHGYASLGAGLLFSARACPRRRTCRSGRSTSSPSSPSRRSPCTAPRP